MKEYTKTMAPDHMPKTPAFVVHTGETVWFPPGEAILTLGVDQRSTDEWRAIRKMRDKSQWPTTPYMSYISRPILDSARMKNLAAEIRADICAWLTAAVPKMPARNFASVGPKITEWKNSLEAHP